MEVEYQVTIIITSYNKQKYIKQAIDSVYKQKCNFNIELIIVDDNSTDNSWLIIKEAAKSSPFDTKLFKNKNNKGITKTWIDICKKAKGKYIARLDGDDYWTDPDKLNKQINQLENDKNSKWCCTDFNMIDKNNNLIAKNCIKNKKVPYADNFENMLIKKGFTNPSSWVIDRNLLNKVNANIDKNAVDDTYNIQLELFMRTKLLLIQDVTNVYRRLPQSDSSLSEKRINGLLKTQLDYLNNYTKYNSDSMLKISLEEYAELQLSQIDQINIINHQKKIMDSLTNEIEKMKSSKTWKIGSFFTKPMHRLFNK